MATEELPITQSALLNIDKNNWGSTDLSKCANLSFPDSLATAISLISSSLPESEFGQIQSAGICNFSAASIVALICALGFN